MVEQQNQDGQNTFTKRQKKSRFMCSQTVWKLWNSRWTITNMPNPNTRAWVEITDKKYIIRINPCSEELIMCDKCTPFTALLTDTDLSTRGKRIRAYDWQTVTDKYFHRDCIENGSWGIEDADLGFLICCCNKQTLLLILLSRMKLKFRYDSRKSYAAKT